jgi:hypothetical protein
MNKCCDVCGKKHFDVRPDRTIKEKLGMEVHVCLDCSAWLSDNDRYDMLLENGIINDEMFDALVVEK